MTQKELENEVREILFGWSSVETKQFTETKENLVNFINKHVAEVIGDDENDNSEAGGIHDELRAEQRKRAGL